MNGLLMGGQFYTPLVAQERLGPILLSERAQGQARAVPRHEHALAYITLVLAGQYSEDGASRPTELPPFTAIFNPAGVRHSAQVGRTGTRLFTVECEEGFLKPLDLRLPEHPVVDTGTGAMLWPGLRMFAAFKAQTGDALIAESHLLEMLCALAGSETGASMPPSWFRRVKDRLHAEFRDNLKVSDIAAEAGVHPVHLARVFRAREGQTPGHYVQRLRVRAACERLRDQDMPLAWVAADCGFADQSHLTRIFKRLVGVTPGAFRKALLAGATSRPIAAPAAAGADRVIGSQPKSQLRAGGLDPDPCGR